MSIKVFLAITCKRDRVREVQKELRRYEEVSTICIVENGVFDVVAFVDVESLEKYRTFSIDKVSRLSHIDDYTSFITLME
jgi:DNA-binding Lrp family transcriptional regulator